MKKGQNNLAIYSGTGLREGYRKRLKQTKGSNTSGKMKDKDRCQASQLDKYMAKRNRSYKHPEYGTWLRKMNSI